MINSVYFLALEKSEETGTGGGKKKKKKNKPTVLFATGMARSP